MPTNSPTYMLRQIDSYLSICQAYISRNDQHPLTVTWSNAAMTQMHGQHLALRALKYLMHCRSASVSDPPSWAAFWQYGNAT